MTSRFPEGVLFDYGGTLVEELSFDARAGNEWLFARAAEVPSNVSFELVLERSRRVTQLVADRREQHQVETPWAALAGLTYDFLGIELIGARAELELGFWKAAVSTRPTPGVHAMLARLRAANVQLGVVSNACFAAAVIRYELAKHGLAEHLSQVIVSAEYAVRKPNVLLFETAVARLGTEPHETWFVGDRLDTDVAGANAAGLTSVWFNPHGEVDPALQHESAKPRVTLTHWDDFFPSAGAAG
jgi:HAD superfamily hydrolase (TIGR01509 family)